jgi:hypothetical protein
MPEAVVYAGVIPVTDLYMGHMMDGAERRGQGADYVHEFMRLGAAEDRGKMNQAQALGYDIAVSAPRQRRPIEDKVATV